MRDIETIVIPKEPCNAVLVLANQKEICNAVLVSVCQREPALIPPVPTVT